MTMHGQCAALVMGIGLYCSAFSQINKCTVNGKATYQQAPCTTGASSTVNLSGAGKADLDSQAAQYWRKEASLSQRKQRVVEATQRGQIFVGMTTEEVIQSWGAPSKVNSSISGAGSFDQWIYEKGGIGRDQYVYVQNGVVASMQSPR